MSGSQAVQDLGLDPASAARMLAALGRGQDSQLAHVNPREIAMLMASGGSGSRNPHTGLLEFDGGGSDQPAPNYTMYGSYNDPSIPAYSGIQYGSTALGPGIQPTSGTDVASQLGTFGANAPDVVAQAERGGAPLDLGNLSPDAIQTIQNSINQDIQFPQLRPTDLPSSTWGNLQFTTEGPNATQQFLPTAGNPNYQLDPTTGQYSFTPQGQQAFQTWNAAQNKDVIQPWIKSLSQPAGFFRNNAAGLGALAFPFAVGGGVAALGGLGLADAGAAGATAGTDAAAALPPELAASTIPETAASVDALGGAGDAATALGAGTGVANTTDTAPFIGASWTSPATSGGAAGGVPFDVSAPAQAAASSAPLVPGGASAASLAPADAAGDIPFDLSTGASQDTGIFGSIKSGLSSAFGPLKGVADALSPIAKVAGVAASGLGLLSDMRKAGQANPIPGMENLQNIAQQSQTQGQILQSYLQNGTLPPAVQASVDQATQSGITAIKSRYAQMGIAPGSSQETQDIARLQQNAVVQGATLADQLTQQGISLSELSAQLYGQLVGINQNLNNETNQAIASLAQSLAGGGIRLVQPAAA